VYCLGKMLCKERCSTGGITCCTKAANCTFPADDLIRQILSHEVLLSVGCTEVGAVALAAAHARSHCTGEVIFIDATVSDEVYANANSAGIPGVQQARGIHLALALGVIAGRADRELEVFSSVLPEEIARAQDIVKQDRVHCAIKHRPDIYVDVIVTTKDSRCQTIIHANQKNIAFCSRCKNDVEKIGQLMRVGQASEPEYHQYLRTCNVAQLIAMARSLHTDCITYIQRGIDQNQLAAELEQHQVDHVDGMQKVHASLTNRGVSGGLVAVASKHAMAATAARMLGGKCSVMSSGGSGNQGVVAISVPKIIGDFEQAPDDLICMGVCLSHLINAKVKAHAGMTSPLCGCSVMAAAGAAAGGVLIRGGSPEQMNWAIEYVIAGLAGVLCDGAKFGCAVKVGVSADLAVRAAYTVMEPDFVRIPYGGIISDVSIDETIALLGKLSPTMEASKSAAIFTKGENVELS
jgi:L-cysteine desulfidase